MQSRPAKPKAESLATLLRSFAVLVQCGIPLSRSLELLGASSPDPVLQIAMQSMTRALEMFIVEGIYTTIPLHRKILADADFHAGRVDTSFIERFLTKNAK